MFGFTIIRKSKYMDIVQSYEDSLVEAVKLGIENMRLRRELERKSRNNAPRDSNGRFTKQKK